MQFWAFISVVIATTGVSLAPILVAAIRGESLPEGLINIADKSVVGFIGLLGTIGALLFRQNQADESRADTTREAFRAVSAAAAGTPPSASATGAADQVADAATAKADEIRGDGHGE
jgi:hypothetical protein